MSKSYLHTPQVIDRQKFLFLLSTNIWILAMRYTGNFIMNLVSLLLYRSRCHKRGGQGTAGNDSFSLGRATMTFKSGPERQKKGDHPSATHIRGRDDSNSRELYEQDSEGKNYYTRVRTAAKLQRPGGNRQHMVQGPGCRFRLWFYQTCLNHPQCSCNNDHSSPCLLPETFKTVSIRIYKYDPHRQWTVLNWNTLIKSLPTI